jgi:hypothetical protein
MNTKYNEGVNANFGQASTLDLYKLYNENINAYSWAKLNFTDDFVGNEEVSLEDAYGNQVNFIIDVTSNTLDGSTDDDGKVIIGVQNLQLSDYAERFKTVIDNVSVNNENNLNFNMIVSVDSDNSLILRQTKKGPVGDTSFLIPDTMQHVTNNNITKFSRIDYSVILIKYNLEELLEKWAINNNAGSFTSVKSYITLKDVSTGIQKPKNYTLELYKIKKGNFLEGLGKDVKSFSDSYVTNFSKFNESLNWSVEGFITDEIEDEPLSTFNVVQGDENIVFDVSDYVQDYISGINRDNFGFLIKFSENNIYDKYSYFAKRLGSRHLVNKSFVPVLDVLIDDSEYIEKINKTDLKIATEGSYSFKIKTPSFINENSLLNFSLYYYDKNKNIVEIASVLNKSKNDILNNLLEEVPVDINGDRVNLVDLLRESRLNFQGSVIQDQLTLNCQASNFLSDSIVSYVNNKNNKELDFYFKVYFSEAEKENIVLLDKKYKIDYTFDVNADLIENDSLYVTCKFDRKLNGNNTAYTISTYFLSLEERYKSSRMPYDLASLDLDDVYYSIYDVDTGKTLQDFMDTEEFNYASRMFYDLEKYTSNIFISEIYKNKRINFKFKAKLKSGKEVILYNEKLSFKVEN